MNKHYDEMIKNMPAGLERAVLRIVSQRVGVEKAILGSAMFDDLRALGFRLSDPRQMREAIKALRRDGHLICSAPGTSGGYWMAASRQEFEDFGQQEFGAKIADMSETWKAMRQAADRQFGRPLQKRLF
jgi:hypothetical protein